MAWKESEDGIVSFTDAKTKKKARHSDNAKKLRLDLNRTFKKLSKVTAFLIYLLSFVFIIYIFLLLFHGLDNLGNVADTGVAEAKPDSDAGIVREISGNPEDNKEGPDMKSCLTDKDCIDGSDATDDQCEDWVCVHRIKKCSGRSGYVCSVDTECPYAFIHSADSDNCCPVECEIKSCDDSDGGMDFDIRGTTSGLNGKYEDICIENDPNGNLKEFYCLENNKVDLKIYDCKAGCEEGACKSLR